MANNIILIGGGARLTNLVEELEDRLINKISEFDPDIDRVEVLNLAQKGFFFLSLFRAAIVP